MSSTEANPSATNSITVLVTGSGGYIGSHACLSLLEAGYNVIALDNMINCWKEEALPQPEALIRVQILAGRQLKFYHGELLCKTSLDEILGEIIQEHKKIDVCMHFAALKAVGESCCKPLEYYKNNVCGTINLIELLQKHGCKSLIYSSSATVYGDPQNLPISEKEPTGVGLTNPYGKTKYMSEEILKDLCSAEKDWKVISLRYFNPVGAHESGFIGEDPTGVPNNLVPFVAQVAAGKLDKLRVFGGDYSTNDGTGVRDYIHIVDLISGHIKALEFIVKDFKGFKAYNLGTGKGYSVLEVIKAFKAASGRDIPYEIVERRAGDIASSYCDAHLAEKELGWNAFKDLDDMCKDVWRWQSRNINGFKKEINPACVLHSAKNLDLLLSNLTKMELNKADRKLHLDAIEAIDQRKMQEDFEKLKKLREVLKASELLKLSKGLGLCERQLSGPGVPSSHPLSDDAKLIEDFENLKKLRLSLKASELMKSTQNGDLKKSASFQHDEAIGIPFCACKR